MTITYAKRQSTVVRAISLKIDTALQKGLRVLWLVSGGSNIALEVAILDELSHASPDKLAVMQVDERYGPVGHVDSNWRQLVDAGFAVRKATCLPVLQPDLSIDQTTERYDRALQIALSRASLVIGQFGIGPDGHTAGILPGTPVAMDDTSTHLVGAYQGKDFLRITMMPSAFTRVTWAFVPAFGEQKASVLRSLKTTISPYEQPAQYLKRAEHCTIYTDQKELEG